MESSQTPSPAGQAVEDAVRGLYLAAQMVAEAREALGRGEAGRMISIAHTEVQTAYLWAREAQREAEEGR